MEQELYELKDLLEELKKRRTHESSTYKPLPKQLDFHKSTKWCRLAFGGNRSGKSRAAAQEIFWWFDESHPHQSTPKSPRIWVISAEYRTIYEGIWTHLKNVIPAWTIERIGPKVPNWDIPSFIESKKGARIDFISAQGGDDTRRKIQAAEIDLASIDEEVQGELITELEMRLVTRGGRFNVSATLVESEDWLLEFEAKAEANDPDIFITRLDSRDNKYNNEAALKRVMGKLSKEEYDVRILGKSRAISGIIYNSWRPEIHEVNPFTIPLSWTRVLIFDPGFRVAAALWVAVSPENYYTAYREMYLYNTSLPEIVAFWRRAEGWDFYNAPETTPEGFKQPGYEIRINDEPQFAVSGIWEPGPNIENIIYRICDPAGFRHHPDGSVGVAIRLANEYDLHFIPGESKDKGVNIEDARQLLIPDLTGRPRFTVFNILEKFIWERRKYRFKGDKYDRNRDTAPDRPIKRDDHLMNCFEYFASAKLIHRPPATDNQYWDKLARTPEEGIKFPKDSRDFKLRLRKARMRVRKEEYMRGIIDG